MDTIPVLCLLGIFCSLALAIDKTVPPEDLDSSGDDEDSSGSGFDSLFVDMESKEVTVYSTSVSTLVPTVEGSTAAQESGIVEEEETKTEDTTKSPETTTTYDIIEDLFAVDTVAKEATTQEVTTRPFQQMSTAEETDTKKHHHHHHHHHHTTTSGTSLPSESDEHDPSTTDIPPDHDQSHNLPEITTTSAPDEESKLHHVPQELTTPAGDLAEHGVLHEETTSGSTSAYADNEVTVEPLDADNLPAVHSVTTTVAEDTQTQKDHHHHHHHHHHHPHQSPTTSSSDIQEEATTRPSDLIEHDEGNVQEAEHTTTLAEDKHHHHHHGHPHHTHHHKTTPSTTMSTEPEKPHKVSTHEPKGRRVHVPDVISTTAIPVINEDGHVPEDADHGDVTSSTVPYNVSRVPFDENDETSDSKEEGSSEGQRDEDIFFEQAPPAVNEGRQNPSDDGNSDASHGIMGRKELLAGIIAGGVAGLVFAAALVAFVLYRMKKKDEGSYSLEEPKQSNGGYQKPREQREFYA